MTLVLPSYPETPDVVVRLELRSPVPATFPGSRLLRHLPNNCVERYSICSESKRAPLSQITGNGTIRPVGSAFEIRFDRWYPQPIGEVWDAIATPEGLAHWLADARLDPLPGGVIELDFGDDAGGAMRGAVARYQRPRVLQYSWSMADEPDAVVRWELPTLDEGTALSLTVTPSGEADDSGMLLAKWHLRLDSLAAYLDGEEYVRDASSLDLLLDHYRESGA